MHATLLFDTERCVFDLGQSEPEKYYERKRLIDRVKDANKKVVSEMPPPTNHILHWVLWRWQKIHHRRCKGNVRNVTELAAFAATCVVAWPKWSLIILVPIRFVSQRL